MNIHGNPVINGNPDYYHQKRMLEAVFIPLTLIAGQHLFTPNVPACLQIYTGLGVLAYFANDIMASSAWKSLVSLPIISDVNRFLNGLEMKFQKDTGLDGKARASVMILAGGVAYALSAQDLPISDLLTSGYYNSTTGAFFLMGAGLSIIGLAVSAQLLQVLVFVPLGST